MSYEVLSTAPDFAKRRRERIESEMKDAIEHESVITIMAPAEKIYNFWRDLNNLPKFMKKLSSIAVKSPTLSHWKWLALKGQLEIEWESEITSETPPTFISWRSREGSTVAHMGEVWFSELPHQRGTEVRVIVNYHPPGGRVTDFIEKIMGESPQRILQDDLRRLRELMEVGLIPTVEGQSRGGLEETINPKLHTQH